MCFYSNKASPDGTRHIVTASTVLLNATHTNNSYKSWDFGDSSDTTCAALSPKLAWPAAEEEQK